MYFKKIVNSVNSHGIFVFLFCTLLHLYLSLFLPFYLCSLPIVPLDFLSFCSYSRYIFISEDLEFRTSDEREHLTYVFLGSGLPYSIVSFLLLFIYLWIPNFNTLIVSYFHLCWQYFIQEILNIKQNAQTPRMWSPLLTRSRLSKRLQKHYKLLLSENVVLYLKIQWSF